MAIPYQVRKYIEEHDSLNQPVSDWGKMIEVTVDGEGVEWEDLSIYTQTRILEQIYEGHYQGKIIEEGEE